MKLVEIKPGYFVNPDHVVSVTGTATHVSVRTSDGGQIVHDVPPDTPHLLERTVKNLDESCRAR